MIDEYILKDVYVEKSGSYVLVPYKKHEDECKCQMWLKNGGVICEWFNVDDIIDNHIHYYKFARKYLLRITNEMTESRADDILKSYEEYKHKKEESAKKKALRSKEKPKHDRIEFEYTQYTDIEREEIVKLSRKASAIRRYSDKLYYTLFDEECNQSKTNKHKTPNYYIAAIRKRLSEIEEELKKYELD